jgi:hypothetical protein
MEQTLKLTTEYMNQRKQFGVVIASFQALRHRVADMKMQLELARSMSYYATLKLAPRGGAPPRAIARQGAAGPVHALVGQQAVQLHGGIGVTDEYMGSHYFKRLTQLEMTGRHAAPPGRGVGACRTRPACLPEPRVACHQAPQETAGLFMGFSWAFAFSHARRLRSGSPRA